MLTYDRFDTRLGPLTVVHSDRGVCHIYFGSSDGSHLQRWLPRHFPGETLAPTPEPFRDVRRELRAFANGEEVTFSFPVDHRNTPFNHRVLDQVRRVPYGQTISYGEIARQVGRPGAARAVGRAVASNPLPLVIPCHRIVGSDGSLTGFGGGLDLKERLLQIEKRRA